MLSIARRLLIIVASGAALAFVGCTTTEPERVAPPGVDVPSDRSWGGIGYDGPNSTGNVGLPGGFGGTR